MTKDTLKLLKEKPEENVSRLHNKELISKTYKLLIQIYKKKTTTEKNGQRIKQITDKNRITVNKNMKSF